MLFGTRETFAYLRRRGCGAMRIAAVPADLARHYPPDDTGSGGGESVAPAPAPRMIANEQVRRAGRAGFSFGRFDGDESKR
jgi:hypothetical protein